MRDRSDDDLGRLIRDDRIDVLAELTGYTGGGTGRASRQRGQHQDELATADREIGEGAAVATVNAIRQLTARRTRSGPGAGGALDDDPVGGENQFGRHPRGPDELGEQIRRQRDESSRTNRESHPSF